MNAITTRQTRNSADDAYVVSEPQTFDWQAGATGDTSWRGKARSWIHDPPGRTRAPTKNRTLAVAFHQTQDPISETDASPALGRTSIGMGVNADGVRRLTPVECERLMSWPDNWTAPEGVKAPDSRRYAACGDGVVANVAEWIARGIREEMDR